MVAASAAEVRNRSAQDALDVEAAMLVEVLSSAERNASIRRLGMALLGT